jgi:hypothetical protein
VNGSSHELATMQKLDIASMLFLLLGAITGAVVIYYSLGIARKWLRQWNHTTDGTVRRAGVSDSSLGSHIATQWTEGRLRLDFLLAVIKKLEVSLEQEVETLRRLDHADPLYESEARRMVEPSLRRFTFDQHLRD